MYIHDTDLTVKTEMERGSAGAWLGGSLGSRVVSLSFFCGVWGSLCCHVIPISKIPRKPRSQTPVDPCRVGQLAVSCQHGPRKKEITWQ